MNRNDARASTAESIRQYASMRVEVNLTLVRAKPRFAFYCPARHLVGFDKVS